MVETVASRSAAPADHADWQQPPAPLADEPSTIQHTTVPAQLAGLPSRPAASAGARKVVSNSQSRLRNATLPALQALSTGSKSTQSMSSTSSPPAQPKQGTATDLLSALDGDARRKLEMKVAPASIEEFMKYHAELENPPDNLFQSAVSFKKAKGDSLQGSPADHASVANSIRSALIKSPELKWQPANGNGNGPIDEERFDAAWNNTLAKPPEGGFNLKDPASMRSFRNKVATNYKSSIPEEAHQRFSQHMAGALATGAFSDWKAGTDEQTRSIGPDQVAEWQYSHQDGDSQRTATRLSDFILNRNSGLHTDGVELQAVASSQHNRIVASMNNAKANAELVKRYPDATALKNDLGKYIAKTLESPPAPGSSRVHNTNDRLRRAQELYNWLAENPDAQFTVTANKEDRHAEVSVRLTIEGNYPDMKKEGRAAGSKPPCFGCVLWFNERGELHEYEDEHHRVPAGPLFAVPNSGMRMQFEAAGVKADKPVYVAPADVEKVAQTVSKQVSNVKLQIHPVTSGNLYNIPRSPTDDDPKTPDYERAFEHGRSLPDNTTPPAV